MGVPSSGLLFNLLFKTPEGFPSPRRVSDPAASRRARVDLGPGSVGSDLRHLCSPLFHPFFDFLFSSLIARLIILFFGAEIILHHEMLGMIVRVLIALTVAEALCALVTGVSQMLGHGQSPARFHVLEGGIDGRHGAVAL